MLYNYVYFAHALTEFQMDFVPDTLAYVFNSTGEACQNVTLLEDNAIEGEHIFSASLISTNLGVIANGSQNLSIQDTNSA